MKEPRENSVTVAFVKLLFFFSKYFILFICFLFKMRRSQAPSRILKRKEGIENEEVVDLFKNSSSNSKHNPKRQCSRNQRYAFSPVKNKFNFAPNDKLPDIIIQEKDQHEELIRKILNKPFKVPISNYTGKVNGFL